MRKAAIFGAAGPIGTLVGAELERRGVPFRVVGRNPEKLAAVPSDAERFVLDVDEAARLDAFLDGATAIISTVGPFPLRSKATTIQPLGTSITRDGQVIYQTSGTGAGIGDLYLVAKAVLRDGAPASRDGQAAGASSGAGRPARALRASSARGDDRTALPPGSPSPCSCRGPA